MSSSDNLPFELPEIFKWRNPIESGLALLSINLIYISCIAQNLGLVYVLTNYLFWFAVSAAIYIKIKSIISGGASASSAKEEDYVFVSQETCQRIVLLINDISTSIAQQIKRASDLTQITSLIKFLVGLYILSVVGSLFSILTLIWLTLTGLFIVSFINYNQQAKQIVTPLINTATTLVKQYSALIYEKIPRYSGLAAKN